MSVPLGPTSNRRVHAARFGAELRKASQTRDVSLKALERATGISHTNLWSFTAGRNLPRLDTALLLAEALQWPKLAELVRAGRTQTCRRPRCGRTFTVDGGNPGKYCSEDCRDIARKLAAGSAPGASKLLGVVRAELDRVHGTSQAVSRKALKAAANEYATAGSKRGMRVDSLIQIVDAQRSAVDAFCRSCEPDGYCQTPACELRPLSPLPLAGYMSREVSEPVKAPGAWGNEANRTHQLEALRAAAARRWTTDEKERMGRLSRARWAALSSEERTAVGTRISSARRSS